MNGSLSHEIGVRYNRGFPAYQELEGLVFYQDNGVEKITLLMLDNNIVEDSFHFINMTDFLVIPILLFVISIFYFNNFEFVFLQKR